MTSTRNPSNLGVSASGRPTSQRAAHLCGHPGPLGRTCALRAGHDGEVHRTLGTDGHQVWTCEWYDLAALRKITR